MENEKRALETVTCGRCGGTGNYSYCQRYGTTCFGCGGTGKKYTKRGQAAFDFLVSLRSKTVGELKVGDKILDTFGGKWRTVETIEIKDKGYEIKTPGNTWAGYGADTVFRVAQTAEGKQATMEAALDYQDTLTKTGTPRKAKAAGRK